MCVWEGGIGGGGGRLLSYFIVPCEKFGVALPGYFRVLLCVQNNGMAASVWDFRVLLCVQTMVWLPVFGIFNVRADVDACDCTRGLCGHRQTVCTGS